MSKDMLRVAEGIMDGAAEESREINLRDVQAVQQYAEGIEISLPEDDAWFVLALCRQMDGMGKEGIIPGTNVWHHNFTKPLLEYGE